MRVTRTSTAEDEAKRNTGFAEEQTVSIFSKTLFILLL
jgi:hypothetical protein